MLGPTTLNETLLFVDGCLFSCFKRKTKRSDISHHHIGIILDLMLETVESLLMIKKKNYVITCIKINLMFTFLLKEKVKFLKMLFLFLLNIHIGKTTGRRNIKRNIII